MQRLVQQLRVRAQLDVPATPPPFRHLLGTLVLACPKTTVLYMSVNFEELCITARLGAGGG